MNSARCPATPAIAKPAAPRSLPNDLTLSLEKVGFRRPGAEPLLESLDLTVRPGGRIAISGPSGSGKSTLLCLLMRLENPSSGRILLGGTPLDQLSLPSLHETVALLTQDTALFNDTVGDNLLIGRSGADNAAVWAALDAAMVGDVVRRMPDGLDTVIGEDGSTVSQGEARRLCLARVLLSRARILLLDEPTAGLDHEAEQAFFTALDNVADGRSVVVVTHAAIAGGTFHRHLAMAQGSLQHV